MSRTNPITKLEEKKTDLLNQLKQIEKAIKAAKQNEIQIKQTAIINALAARGLLDQDLDSIIASIAKAASKSPSPVAESVSTEPTNHNIIEQE